MSWLMRTKNLYRISVSSFLFILLFLCCRKEEEIQPEIILAKEELAFPMSGEIQVLAIKTNMAWTAVSSEIWCTLEPGSGAAGTKQLNITVSPNTEVEAREAVITITAGQLTREVTVMQSFEKLILEQRQYNVEANAAEIVVNIESSSAYSREILPGWITLKSTSPDNATQTFTIAENNALQARAGKIVYKSGRLTDTVVVTQTGRPLWIEPDATGMSHNAKALASQIFLGWNLGNSLEVPGSETAWGNPVTTQTLIDSVKKAGFNAVRIPCAWNSHLEDPAANKIRESWLARVKEVIDYCYNNSMFVIINIHWDEGWLEENPTLVKQAEVNAKQKALWEQIAVYFRNYDEHLLFAGTNEVHAGYGEPTAENITVQLSYNQTFVDAVRSTGGKNAYRNLIVQAYNTNINHAVAYLELPDDDATDRMMVEVHYYDPWDFCGDTGSSIYLWGNDFTLYGPVSSWGQESHVDQQFAKMKTNFVDKGYPVILGEYGAIFRSSLPGAQLDNHKASRAYFYKYVTRQAKNNGMVPFIWDNGYTGNNTMALFNRPAAARYDSAALDALVEGAGEGIYP